MDRRTVLTGGVGLGAAALLTGCGGATTDEVDLSSDPADVSGKVVHWTYPMGKTQADTWWEPLVKEFNEAYPKVEVDVVIQPWKDRQQSLVTAVASRTAPDVVYFNPGFVPKFASEDLLLPMDDVLGEDRGDFLDASLRAHTYRDTLYGLPLLMEVANPGYSPTVLDDIGLSAPPVTFDEIRAAAEACVAKDYTFAAYEAAEGSLNHTFYPFVWSAGGELIDEAGTTSLLNEEPAVKAMTLLRELADIGAWDKQSLTQPMAKMEQTRMARGKELMGLTMQVPLVEEVMGKGAVKGAEPFRDVEQVAFGSVGALAIFNTTEAPQAAAAWAKFLTSAGMERFLEASSYLPPRKSLADMWQSNEDNAFKSQWLETVNVGLVIPQSVELHDVVRPSIQSCLLGRTEPEAAMAEAAERVNEVLARG